MNKLYKSLVYGLQVSLSVLETTELVNDAIKTHNLSDGGAKLLGGLLTACAYMAGCLKSEKGGLSAPKHGMPLPATFILAYRAAPL